MNMGISTEDTTGTTAERLVSRALVAKDFSQDHALRRELADAIENRNAADKLARAAKVTAHKAEALMCAAGEKVAYGGHASTQKPPKGRSPAWAKRSHGGSLLDSFTLLYFRF